MLVTMWILAGVFGLIGGTLFFKFMASSISAAEAVMLVISIIVFAFASGMLYDGVVPFGSVITIGQ